MSNTMIHSILLGILIAATTAQRPSFAGSGPVGVPKLASRFENSAAASTGTEFTNRFGVDTESSSTVYNWQQNWPKENRPFSVINSEHIRKQLYPNGRGNSNSFPQDVVSTNDLGQGNAGNTVGRNQFVQDRASFGSASSDSQNSFRAFKNNQWITYVYDPVLDAWYPKRTY